jgi:hypothetical protein
MISHQNVIAQCLQVLYAVPPESTHALAVLPLFHSKLLENPTEKKLTVGQ